MSAGDLTTRQLSSEAYRRLFRDVYLDSNKPVTYLLRCFGAAMIAPPEAILTGRSAAAVRGLSLAKLHDPIEFTVEEKYSFGPLQGLRIRRTHVPIRDNEHESWRDIRIASAERMALDLMLFNAPRTRSYLRRLRSTVADLDQIVRGGLVHAGRLPHLVEGRRDQGITLARHAVSLIDPRAESPPESELRVVLAHGGLPAEPQFEVWQEGCFLGRLDLAYPEAKVAVEYDGKWHDESQQRLHDQARRDRIREAGWQFVIFKAEDLAGEASLITRRVGEALKSSSGAGTRM